MRSVLARLWWALGRFLAATKPTPALGFVGLAWPAAGLLGPFLGVLKLAGVLAMIWGAGWLWGEKRYNSGHKDGYALAKSQIAATINEDAAEKEAEAERAVAELAPTPEGDLEIKALCAQDPDCRERGTR